MGPFIARCLPVNFLVILKLHVSQAFIEKNKEIGLDGEEEAEDRRLVEVTTTTFHHHNYLPPPQLPTTTTTTYHHHSMENIKC